MTTFQISPEAIALRETSKRTHAERDALLLQEQLLQANARIAELEAKYEPEERAPDGDPT